MRNQVGEQNRPHQSHIVWTEYACPIVVYITNRDVYANPICLCTSTIINTTSSPRIFANRAQLAIWLCWWNRQKKSRTENPYRVSRTVGLMVYLTSLWKVDECRLNLKLFFKIIQYKHREKAPFTRCVRKGGKEPRIVELASSMFFLNTQVQGVLLKKVSLTFGHIWQSPYATELAVE